MAALASHRKRRSPARLAERFRRAVCTDDLAAAKRAAELAFKECTDAQPFTIQNQDMYGLVDGATQYLASLASVPDDGLVQGGSNRDRSTSTGSGAISTVSAASARSLQVPSASVQVGSVRGGGDGGGIASLCPALSASQYSFARHCRARDRNREAGRAKSSLVLAVESGASMEMVQWLLDMGHEHGQFSVDARGCTVVSLAAQHDRLDVIEACCIDAVAHAASIHHVRTVQHRQREYMQLHHRDEGEDEELSEEDNNDVGHEERETQASLSHGANSDRISVSKTSQAARRPGTFPASSLKGAPAPSNTTMQLSDDSEVDDLVISAVQQLLDAPDELGRTALSLASMSGHLEVVRLLIDYGASCDQADYEGNTPLHYAAAYNHLLVVQLLIERGCSFAIKNVFDFTAADYAYTTSLKSALEAFARAQHEGKRARNRAAAGDSSSSSSSPLRSMASSARGSDGAPKPRLSPAQSHIQSSPVPSADGVKGLLSSTSHLSLSPGRANSTHASTAASSSSTLASTNNQQQQVRSPDLARRGSPRFKQTLLR